MATPSSLHRPEGPRSHSRGRSATRIADWVNETSAYSMQINPRLTSPSSKSEHSGHSKRRGRVSSFLRSSRRIHRAGLLRSARHLGMSVTTSSQPQLSSPTSGLSVESGSDTAYPALVLLISSFAVTAMLPSLLVLLAFVALLSFVPLTNASSQSESVEDGSLPRSATLSSGFDGMDGDLLSDSARTHRPTQSSKRKRA